MASRRRRLRGSGKSIRLEKGDTLGGTASLLLLDRIGGGGPAGSSLGRKRISPVARFFRGLMTWALILVTAAALIVLSWDWLEDGVRSLSSMMPS